MKELTIGQDYLDVGLRLAVDALLLELTRRLQQGPTSRAFGVHPAVHKVKTIIASTPADLRSRSSPTTSGSRPTTWLACSPPRRRGHPTSTRPSGGWPAASNCWRPATWRSPPLRQRSASVPPSTSPDCFGSSPTQFLALTATLSKRPPTRSPRLDQERRTALIPHLQRSWPDGSWVTTNNWLRDAAAATAVPAGPV